MNGLCLVLMVEDLNKTYVPVLMNQVRDLNEWFVPSFGGGGPK